MIRNTKKIIGLLFSVVFCTVIAAGMPQIAKAAEVTINETNFPDGIFRDYVKQQFDKDNSNGLSEGEIANVKEINVDAKGISSLKGIEHFTALTVLYCYSNQLTALDISKNTALTELDCSGNQLTALDVSKNTALTKVYCSENQLTALDVSKNTALTGLYCYSNQLTALDVSKNTALTELDCYFNQLTALDVSKNTALTGLYCHSNQLTALDVSKNTALTGLYCHSSQLSALDVSKNTALTKLDCSENQLTALDVSKNMALTSLDCSENQLSFLNVNNNTALTKLDCSENQLTALDVSNDTALTTLNCYSNQLTALDVSKNMALAELYCSENQLTALDVSKNTALTGLDCYSNQLTALDVSKNTALTGLGCSSNQLTALDVSKNTALTGLYCHSNQLTALDVSKNTALTTLYCHSNQLTALDISNDTALTTLYCYTNRLTELKLHSQTYGKLPLYKKYLYGDVSLSDLQNITETKISNPFKISELKVIDITKPATYKVNGKDFTIIYADKVIMPGESPSPEPGESPSPEPGESPSPEPSESQSPGPSESPSPVPGGTPSVSPAPSPSPSPAPGVQSGAHIFNDYNYTSPVVSGVAVIYGNGINKRIDGNRVNNKVLTLYTDILASYKYTPNSNGTVKSAAGKVIVAVTKTNVKPEVNSRNKVTDTSASKIARAKIKNGQITVTAAGKEGGLVYLWVIDTGSKGVSASCPINVKLAPKKLEVQGTTGTKLSNTKIQNGTALNVHIAGFAGQVKTEDCTYTAAVSPNCQQYVQITPNGATGQDFTITAKGLKNNKNTKASITFTCSQNGKKVKFSLTITK